MLLAEIAQQSWLSRKYGFDPEELAKLEKHLRDSGLLFDKQAPLMVGVWLQKQIGESDPEVIKNVIWELQTSVDDYIDNLAPPATYEYDRYFVVHKDAGVRPGQTIRFTWSNYVWVGQVTDRKEGDEYFLQNVEVEDQLD